MTKAFPSDAVPHHTGGEVLVVCDWSRPLQSSNNRGQDDDLVLREDGCTSYAVRDNPNKGEHK